MPLASSARPVVVRGNLLNTDTSGAVYEITSDGSKTILTNPAYATSYAASGGGTYHEGIYYMSKIWMSGYSSQTYNFDTSQVPWTSQDADANGSSTVLSTDYAYDAVDNVIYGFHKLSGTNYVIGRITPGSSWTRRLVQVQQGPDMVDVKIDCSDSANKWHGLAFDASNQLWVITYGGRLNKVDKNTGAMTLVGETGITPTFNGSAAFDFKTGKLYWAVKNAEGSAVYEVDTTTAAAVKVMDVPDNLQLMGIYIPAPAAEDGAPASATNIRYETVGGSLEGNILFDIPSTTFDDQPASGSVNYSVTVSGQDPVTGTSAYGQTVSVPFTAAASGMLSVEVVISNETGNSPVAKHEAYVGFGVPSNPTGASLTYENGVMTLSWDAVTTVADGKGYLGTVTYNVVRKTGGEILTVAEGIEETSYSEAAEEPSEGLAGYTYEVTAYNGSMASAGSATASLTIGSLPLPYTNSFDTIDDFRQFASFNVEPASKTWVHDSSGKRVTIGYDKAYTKDDWLITPPVKVTAGNTYAVSVVGKSQSGSYKELAELSCGFSPTPEGMTILLARPDEDLPTTATIISGSYTATQTGIMYFGIHACSKKDMSSLIIDDFDISEAVAEPGVMDVYTLDPESGSVVESISTILISFPESNNYDGIDEYVDPVDVVTITCGNQVYRPTSSEIVYNYYEAELHFDAITDPGEYTLHIPRGVWKEFDTEEDTSVNPEITAKYIIEDNYVGVSEIGTAQTVTVVDAMGRTLLRNADRRHLNTLAPGLYIVNGLKKVVR